MKIAKSFKIWFLLILFVLSTTLAIGMLNVDNIVHADETMISTDTAIGCFEGGASKEITTEGKLHVTLNNDNKTVKVKNQLVIDDFGVEFSTTNVKSVEITFESASCYGAGVSETADGEIVSTVKNVVKYDIENSKFYVNGQNEKSCSLSGDINLSVKVQDGNFSAQLSEEISIYDDMYKIGGTEKTPATISFKCELGDGESSIDFSWFDQRNSQGGNWRQTFANADGNITTIAKPCVVLENEYNATTNTIKILNGKKYDIDFKAYSLFGFSGTLTFAKADGETGDLRVNDDTIVAYVDKSATTPVEVKLAVKDGDAVLETFILSVFNEEMDTEAPTYTASEKALNAYRQKVAESVKTTANGQDCSIKLGEKITIPSLKGLVSDVYSGYENLTHTLYYITPSSTSGSTSGWTITVSDVGKYMFYVVFTDEVGNSMEKDDFYKTENGVTTKGKYFNDFVFTFEVQDDYPIEVTAAETQEKGYLNTEYTFTSFTVIASSYTPSYKLLYSATKDGEYKEIAAKSTLPSDEDDYDDEDKDFTYNEINGFAYDGKLTFTPIKKGYYKVECVVTSNSQTRSVEAETQVVEISESPTVVKPDTHWLQNHVWSVVFLSIGTLCLIAIIVLLCVKPKEEKEDEDVE